MSGGQRQAELAGAGEVGGFHFVVPSAATCIMTTEGPTDTLLTLHGPNDPDAVLAFDDHRGRNARREPC